MFPTVDPALITRYKESIRAYHQVLCHNFRSNTWNIEAINKASLQINNDIAALSRENVIPPILVKMRNELTNLDKIVNRIKQIKDTDFIVAAYAIPETAIVFVVIIVLFLKSESMIEAPILIAAFTAMIVGLLMLSKDMDEPFEVDTGASVDGDLFLIFDLENYIKE